MRAWIAILWACAGCSGAAFSSGDDARVEAGAAGAADGGADVAADSALPVAEGGADSAADPDSSGDAAPADAAPACDLSWADAYTLCLDTEHAVPGAGCGYYHLGGPHNLPTPGRSSPSCTWYCGCQIGQVCGSIDPATNDGYCCTAGMSGCQ